MNPRCPHEARLSDPTGTACVEDMSTTQGPLCRKGFRTSTPDNGTTAAPGDARGTELTTRTGELAHPLIAGSGGQLVSESAPVRETWCTQPRVTTVADRHIGCSLCDLPSAN